MPSLMRRLAMRARFTCLPASLLAAPLAAQASSPPRDTAAAGDTSSHSADSVRVSSSDDAQALAFLGTLVAPAVGWAAGAMFPSRCFGDGGVMAGRAFISGTALAVTVAVAAPRWGHGARPGGAHPSRTRQALTIVGATALGGAAVGLPIGLYEGAQGPRRCWGGPLPAGGEGAWRMGAAALATGAALAVVAGASTLLHLGPHDPAAVPDERWRVIVAPGERGEWRVGLRR